MMKKRERKEILFSVFTVLGTALVFFVIGCTAMLYHGPAYTMTTEIEYVQPSASVTEESTPGASTNEKIDLNTATEEQLMTIPGIGPTYARRIVQYRKEIGAFLQLEQLKEVEGVGEIRYQQWLPYLTIAQDDRLEE